jgi:hypothetical protein
MPYCTIALSPWTIATSSIEAQLIGGNLQGRLFA